MYLLMFEMKVKYLNQYLYFLFLLPSLKAENVAYELMGDLLRRRDAGVRARRFVQFGHKPRLQWESKP